MALIFAICKQFVFEIIVDVSPRQQQTFISILIHLPFQAEA